jgi:hypothetical protein
MLQASRAFAKDFSAKRGMMAVLMGKPAIDLSCTLRRQSLN